MAGDGTRPQRPTSSRLLMERVNPETGKPWKYGEIGPDGRIFLAYRRKSRINKDGTFQMNWLTPEAWAKREISCREAAKRSQKRKVILVRRETSPDDLVGMVAAEGILTSRGGKTSHAAVVARGMGRPLFAALKA